MIRLMPLYPCEIVEQITSQVLLVSEDELEVSFVG